MNEGENRTEKERQKCTEFKPGKVKEFRREQRAHDRTKRGEEEEGEKITWEENRKKHILTSQLLRRRRRR